jgi:hypothetical protein
VLPWRESSARALPLMVRRKIGRSEGFGATYFCLFSPLLLGAGAHVVVGHFENLLAAERHTAPSVWHLKKPPSSFCFCCFGVVYRIPLCGLLWRNPSRSRSESRSTSELRKILNKVSKLSANMARLLIQIFKTFVPESARLTLLTTQTTERLCVLTHNLLIWRGNGRIAGSHVTLKRQEPTPRGEELSQSQSLSPLCEDINIDNAARKDL